jgi:predicted acylesterase/phospholipase RssA
LNRLPDEPQYFWAVRHPCARVISRVFLMRFVAMGPTSTRLLGAARDVTAAVRAMRAPLLLALLAFFVLSTPAQVLELYLILARNPGQLVTQVSLAIGSLALLAFFLTYASRSLARAAEDVTVRAGERSPQASAFKLLPIGIGLMPLAGTALGLWRALKGTLTETALGAAAAIKGLKSEDLLTQAVEIIRRVPADRDIADSLNFKQLNDRVDLTVAPAILKLPEYAESLTLAIYSGIALAFAIGGALCLSYSRTPRSEYFEPTDRAFHPLVTYLVGAVFLALLALITAQHWNAGGQSGFDFTQIPRTLGTLGLLNISLISLVYVSSLLTRWSDKHGIPVVAPLLVFAALISTRNWNENHRVRLIQSAPQEIATRKLAEGTRFTPTVMEAFDAWMQARPPEYVKRFEGRPYPIYVVAAQGGGMYAANLSGLTLARLYDRCPALRHHLFAVSGVSGGSIGAGFLAALLREPGPELERDACTTTTPDGGFGPLETRMELLLQSDFLAPVAASFLFPDLLQRFIPVPVEAFDRARAFEAGVEEAWTGVVGTKSNPLREAFWKHWSPRGAAPMLFLNATIAETGQQVSIAPARFHNGPSYIVTELKTLRERAELPEELDVPLSTAMSLSARFPLVMPAGLVSTKTKTLRLVDGGYFDNSGVELAEGIIQTIRGPVCASSTDFSNCADTRPGHEQRTYAFRTMVLTEFDFLREAFEIGRDPNESEAGLNELLSPLRAMLNTRVARGELVVGKLQPLEPGVAVKPLQIPTAMVTLNHRLYGLPLGWQLSKDVQAIISAQIGEPEQCVRTDTNDFFKTLIQVAALDLAFDKIAAKAQNRPPRPARQVFGTPFVELLKKLQDNHCGLFRMLQADGIAAEFVPVSAN